MRTLKRLLLSRRNAVGAIALLAILLALASAAPQGEALEDLRRRRPRVAWALERLGPAEVARSPVFLGLTAWVAAGVLLSMVTRIRARAGGRPAGALERFVERRVVRVAGPAAEAERRATEALRRAGYRGGLSGWRGGAGFWGSMAFHAGLVVVLAGVAASAAGRFSGEVVLVEGFPLDVSAAVFLRADPPAALDALRGVRLAVSDVSAIHADGARLVDVSAVLLVLRPGRPAERRFVSVNVPVEVGAFQLTLHAYGFAPEVVAIDPQGRVRAEGTLALRLLPPGTEDSLVLESGGALRFRLFPAGDSAAPGGGSPVPSRPVLAFRWYERGALVAEGRVEPGGEAVAAGHRVAFPRFVYWADLVVGRDPGVPWFAIGALFAIGGLAVRLAFHEQSWEAVLAPAEGGTEVRLTLSARYFPALLRERADRAAGSMEG